MEVQSPVQVMGIDAGGTMTDTFFVRSDGRFVVGKAQSNPADESLAIFNSSQDALAHWQRGVDDVYPELLTCVYSGTAMLNRVVQRKGLEVGLIVNRGFEHVHSMGRAIQSYLGYALEERIHLNTHRYDEPLVPLARTRGVTERTDVQGEIVIPLREQEVRQAVRELVDAGSKALVIVLLQSHKNGTSERRARDVALDELKQLGAELPVFASVDYYPQRKESHRMNTTILEAYAAEPSRQTLRKVSERFHKHGAKFDLRVMATHGGTISWKAKELARTIVSGPIGGVIGSKLLGSALGYENIACSDIGGTSFDMALITKGNFTIASDPDMARLVLSLPLVAMDSVGAGAGSFVRLDPYSGSIKLGPDSAGYRVGTCWPESGLDTVTVSDCHVVLGYLNPDNFLGGAIKLDVNRARLHIKDQIADPLGLSIEEAAAGVIELLDLQLHEYLRSNVSAKGYNPTDFVCFSYGGAGPVHTYGYTEGLGFKDVIVPAWAAGFSAFGCACADFEYRYDKSVDLALPQAASDADKAQAAATIQQAWSELAGKVIEEFRINGFKAGDVILRPGYRMQYMGQLNDLEIDSPIASAGTAQDWDRIVEAFEDTYGRVYASSARSPELGFSVTGAIMRGMVITQKPVLPEDPEAGPTPPEDAKLGTRRLYRHKTWHEATLWKMEALKPGNTIAGPAIIESDATTFVVPLGFATTIDKHRLFHLKEVHQGDDA
ncbi:hydantoinase/oxoprolinase family protein [Paraburkholderia silvatlantica]|uniref:Acetone carboxylase beta subunit n=1 Tax=Paraburkholderia silvatlantica TaxID=321895 RepID=A0A2U1A8B8_9BURK|nr:hydantoinase/oxoprolinase family protein [Paraburkholderia silvatlantica]MBB2929036.1 acetone carboxylase beta subunit [Paraburkholderia silvatlantica]PVY29131.1 acetone carboxylase beta subunit [Paraburkholderia silvatlantica]PXW36606.1 acetone carboxylase beta subunit [Paraburkholderia silvatlantica]PYE22090.1 acetone carboxylase beta subunit [Paraburkholderia silvatlantica]TDQ98994.1 acetone carboxylase beta subunit [Paraburkholderia silvatlantica]